MLSAGGIPFCSPPTLLVKHSLRVEERDAGRPDNVYLAEATGIASAISALTGHILDALKFGSIMAVAHDPGIKPPIAAVGNHPAADQGDMWVARR